MMGFGSVGAEASSRFELGLRGLLVSSAKPTRIIVHIHQRARINASDDNPPVTSIGIQSVHTLGMPLVLCFAVAPAWLAECRLSGPRSMIARRRCPPAWARLW